MTGQSGREPTRVKQPSETVLADAIRFMAAIARPRKPRLKKLGGSDSEAEPFLPLSLLLSRRKYELMIFPFSEYFLQLDLIECT